MSSQSLADIFAELGISQYLDAFVDQGFDTWDTILDITESDLDALNVKLGHRRKLQRRIANSRGFAPDAALASPTIANPAQRALEDVQHADLQTSAASHTDELSAPVVTKRKYRRHPKPDENAPERPPSAYVLFSNKTRDDLKDRSLSFTEIAKLVGENWQALSPAEKEPYESQAQAAKEKYNCELAEYKRTPQYRDYLAYLQDFKAKHAVPATSSDGKDCQKRMRLSGASTPPSGAQRRARSHTSVGMGNGSRSASRSASRGDGRKGSEPPPARREHRVNSISSTAGDSSHIDRSSVEPSPSPSASPRDPPLHHAPIPAWLDSSHGSHHQHQHGRQTLPSLSNILEGQVSDSHEPSRGTTTAGAAGGSGAGSYSLFSFHNSAPASAGTGLPASPPGLIGGEPSSSYPFSMRKDLSSAASTTSASSVGGYPHTPVEGSLPIHLLLVSGNGKHEQDRIQPRRSASPEGRSSFLHLERHPSSDSHSTTSISPPLSSAQGYFPSIPFPSMTSSHAAGRTTLPGISDLDGMSALLQAGEIVGRQVK